MGDRGRNTEQNLIRRGGLITIFTIVVWILCIVKFIPVSNIIGDGGITVFAICFELFIVLFLLFHFSLPQFMSKLIGTRISRGQYKNAKSVFKICLGVNLLLGIVMAVIYMAISNVYSAQFTNVPYGAFAMKCISIAFVLYAAIACFKGYFQGMGTMMPSCVSALLEQLVTLTVSVILAYSFRQYGDKVAALLHEQNHVAAYGATSICIAVVIGAFVSLLFLIFVYTVYQRNFKKNLLNDMTKTKEETFEMISQLYSKMFPIAAINVLFFGMTIVSQKIYFSYMTQNVTINDALTEYGVFYGKYRVLILIPIVLMAGMCQNVTPIVSRLYVKEAYHQLRLEFRNGLSQILMVGGVASLLLTVLSGVISNTLFKQNGQLAGTMLLIGGFGALLYGLALYTLAFIKGLNRFLLGIISVFGSLLLQSVVLYILLHMTKLGVLSLVISVLLFPLLVAVINMIVIKKNIE